MNDHEVPAHQIESLARLDMGDAWLRAVLYQNGAALFSLSETADTSGS